MWYRIHTDPILRCFDNLEGLNCENLLVSVANGLRMSTEMPSQDLSGAWITVQK
jgi:hypothetical protein